MGIKDWFGGDKKKAAFRDKIKEAVSDGRLDTQDLKTLEEFRKEMDLAGAGDDRTVLRREVYNEAANAQNVRIETFPDSLVASYFDFPTVRLLKFAADEKANVDVKAAFGS